jgi:hypothetical protein
VAREDTLVEVLQEAVFFIMDGPAPPPVLFAGMYSTATTENDGLALVCKTAYALQLAFFGKRPTEIPPAHRRTYPDKFSPCRLFVVAFAGAEVKTQRMLDVAFAFIVLGMIAAALGVWILLLMPPRPR